MENMMAYAGNVEQQGENDIARSPLKLANLTQEFVLRR
jgi:hypothetical protein